MKFKQLTEEQIEEVKQIHSDKNITWDEKM